MNEYTAPEFDVALASHVSLMRNFADTPFDSLMSDEHARYNIERVDEALHMARRRSEFSFVRMADTSEAERVWMVNCGQINPGMLKRTSRGAAFFSKGGTINVLVNETNHVRVTGVMPGLQIGRAADLCCGAGEWIEKAADYAFDTQFGYLTVDAAQCGSGMTALVAMHLPALCGSDRLNALTRQVLKPEQTLGPLAAYEETPADALYQLNATARLGQPYEEMLDRLSEVAQELIEAEREERLTRHRGDPLVAQDKLARAVAVIEAARLMPEPEMRSLCSALRVSAALGLIDIPLAKIDQMRLSLLDPALDMSADETMDERTRDALRADTFRDRLYELLPRHA